MAAREQGFAGVVELAELPQLLRPHVGVGQEGGAGEARALHAHAARSTRSRMAADGSPGRRSASCS